jgi:hypothetical protein
LLKRAFRRRGRAGFLPSRAGRMSGQAIVEMAMGLSILLLMAIGLFAVSYVWARWQVARTAAYALCEYAAETDSLPNEWQAELVIRLPLPEMAAALQEVRIPPALGSVEITILDQLGNQWPMAIYSQSGSAYRRTMSAVRPPFQAYWVRCRMQASLGPVGVPILGAIRLSREETFRIQSRWH